MEMPSSHKGLRDAPGERVVYDGLTHCPYIPGQIARLPMRLPDRPLSPDDMDERLLQGDRRQGVLLYRPRCPLCNACEPIRLPVDDFHLSRTQRRIRQRGDREVRVVLGRPRVSTEKVALYNAHKQGRGLWVGDAPIDADGYQEFLVDTCVDSIELEYWHEGRLVGVAISDRAAKSLSAVYCFYDPELSRLSLGVYSILKQIEMCRDWSLSHLYLGLYVGACAAMSYKASYLPHERLVQGAWRRFGRAEPRSSRWNDAPHVTVPQR